MPSSAKLNLCSSLFICQICQEYKKKKKSKKREEARHRLLSLWCIATGLVIFPCGSLATLGIRGGMVRRGAQCCFYSNFMREAANYRSQPVKRKRKRKVAAMMSGNQGDWAWKFVVLFFFLVTDVIVLSHSASFLLPCSSWYAEGGDSWHALWGSAFCKERL